MGKNRRCGRFVQLPHKLLNDPDYIELSNKAKVLLVDVIYQYNGNNNGDLSITLRILSKRGWNSNSQIASAKNELISRKWIELTRMGGRNKPSLFAMTWKRIDYCGGKLGNKRRTGPTRILGRKLKS